MSVFEDYGMPWNNLASDRLMAAAEWREYWGSVLTDGVVFEAANQLKVSEASTPAKSVVVDTGTVSIQGIGRKLTPAQTITIADNASGNPRIDRIVARADYTNRLIEFDVLQGTPAASPTAPVLTQTSTTYEIALAQVAVANGFTTITDANITDEREFAKTVGQARFESENDLNQYSRDVTAVDASGNPTTVEYDRSDATLAVKRIYSNADVNGRYQTATETFYETDGTTVYKTVTYTFTYLTNGLIDTATRTVVYA